MGQHERRRPPTPLHRPGESEHNGPMEHFEFTVEVGPIDTQTVERLKSDGYAVFKGDKSWRIQKVVPMLGRESVGAQARAATLEAIERYGLSRLSDPPAISLRDPDSRLDSRPDLILEDARRAYDAPPRPRPKRKWYQKAMELGLGERKGD